MPAGRSVRFRRSASSTFWGKSPGHGAAELTGVKRFSECGFYAVGTLHPQRSSSWRVGPPLQGSRTRAAFMARGDDRTVATGLLLHGCKCPGALVRRQGMLPTMRGDS